MNGIDRIVCIRGTQHCLLARDAATREPTSGRRPVCTDTSRTMGENGTSPRSKLRQRAKYACFVTDKNSTVLKLQVSVVEETLPLAPPCKNNMRLRTWRSMPDRHGI